MGPFLLFFDQPPPAWLIKARLCGFPVRRTGTLFRWTKTRTGNVLLKREVFERRGLRFDERFRTGGSDQDFFRRAMTLGGGSWPFRRGQFTRMFRRRVGPGKTL